MSVTVLLELQLKPGDLEAARAELRAILRDTRAFEGCEDVEVLVDAEDEHRMLVVERWASEEADAAYRAWRAGDGKSGLGDLLAAPPSKRSYVTAPTG